MSQQTLVGTLAALAVTYVLYKMTSRRRRVIRIGTRMSQLAMWQANHVAELLSKLDPTISPVVVGIKTVGDKDTKTPLSAFTDKGVFTKELDEALMEGKIDCAVHCVKDLPSILPYNIIHAAILERGDTEDCVILHEKHRGLTLDQLPAGSKVGTSSVRRRAILAKHHPHLTCLDIRGNVNTRLAKLDRGDYDAIVVARTGFLRLGMGNRISEVLSAEKYGYAVGQGALSIVCIEGDPVFNTLNKIEHQPTMLAALAERALLTKLEGGCKVPIAVRSSIQQTSESEEEKYAGRSYNIKMTGWVISPNGKKCIQADVSGHAPFSPSIEVTRQVVINLGTSLADELRKQGAETILAEVRKK